MLTHRAGRHLASILPCLISGIVASYTVATAPLLIARDGPPPGGKDDCESLYREIAECYRSLPDSFRDITSAEADRLGARVESSVSACRRYLASCAGEERAAEVHFYFGKYLYLLSARVRAALIKELRSRGGDFPSDELRARLDAYHRTIAEHAETARDTLPERSSLLPLSLELLGQARQLAGDHELAREAFERLIREFPDHEAIGSAINSLGRVLIELEEYEEGIRLVSEALEKERFYYSPKHPYLRETLWKLCEKKGDCSGMLRCAEEAIEIYPHRLEDSAVQGLTRDVYERFLVETGFRHGFALFALGDLTGATASLRAYIDGLESRQEQQSLLPYAKIYLDRASRTLDFITELAGRPAPADFELGDLWVTDARVSLEKDRGKVIALVFRSSGDRRSAPFVEGVDAFCAADADLRMLAISYLKGTNILRQLDELRAEIQELGYRDAAGFDPGTRIGGTGAGTEKSIFRAYGARVGTASFYVIDREGRPTWYKQDPKETDVNLAVSVLRRVHGELDEVEAPRRTGIVEPRSGPRAERGGPAKGGAVMAAAAGEQGENEDAPRDGGASSTLGQWVFLALFGALALAIAVGSFTPKREKDPRAP